jgi:hypothetical protein
MLAQPVYFANMNALHSNTAAGIQSRTRFSTLAYRSVTIATRKSLTRYGCLTLYNSVFEHLAPYVGLSVAGCCCANAPNCALTFLFLVAHLFLIFLLSRISSSRRCYFDFPHLFFAPSVFSVGELFGIRCN